MTIINTIMSMAMNMQMNVVAEGVETEEQLKYIIEAGCEVVQGFLCGRPMPAEQIGELLKSG